MGKRERRRERQLEALRARGWAPSMNRREQRELDTLRVAIERAGYKLEFVEWCESGDTPGLLGQKAGVTIPHLKVVRVRTRDMTPLQVLAIIGHELEHVYGADWATDHEHLGLMCGGRRDRMWNPVGPPKPEVHAVDG